MQQGANSEGGAVRRRRHRRRDVSRATRNRLVHELGGRRRTYLHSWGRVYFEIRTELEMNFLLDTQTV
jgi:hypothetical protein